LYPANREVCERGRPAGSAKQVIEDHTVWKLTQEQQKIFIDGLMNPPAPNRKLQEAYKRFRKYKATTRR
jgi:uncharacterized protein (DUF1778 family)